LGEESLKRKSDEENGMSNSKRMCVLLLLMMMTTVRLSVKLTVAAASQRRAMHKSYCKCVLRMEKLLPCTYTNLKRDNLTLSLSLHHWIGLDKGREIHCDVGASVCVERDDTCIKRRSATSYRNGC
jgi:hypothetical protein